MVNDKMINGFMSKKQYITPKAELTRVENLQVMRISPPPQPGGAPIYID